MKIVATSNLGDETQSDRLVAENIKSEREAMWMVDGLNERSGPHSRDYYQVTLDDYVLYRWEP